MNIALGVRISRYNLHVGKIGEGDPELAACLV